MRGGGGYEGPNNFGDGGGGIAGVIYTKLGGIYKSVTVPTGF